MKLVQTAATKRRHYITDDLLIKWRKSLGKLNTWCRSSRRGRKKCLKRCTYVAINEKRINGFWKVKSRDLMYRFTHKILTIIRICRRMGRLSRAGPIACNGQESRTDKGLGRTSVSDGHQSRTDIFTIEVQWYPS